MKKEIYKNMAFIFDEENGTTVCEMKYDNNYFYGEAVCANEDMDMLNKKTGQEIAFHRACIDVMKYEKNKLRIEYNGLKSAYYSMKHSKKFNPKSYEAIMLRRQMNMRENDISQLKVDIKTEKQYIKNYIEEKDAFYKKMRTIRKEKELEKEHSQDNEN